MKNQYFDIKLSESSGFITSIVNPADKDEMNWCSQSGNWGKIHRRNWNPNAMGTNELTEVQMNLSSFEASDERSVAVYECSELSVTVTRCFAPSGNFIENYRIKNITDSTVCLSRDNFGIEISLPNDYVGADECMIHQCHAHIWCGHNVAWINALKMGVSNINLGLFLTKGAIDSYEQNGCRTNCRGAFVLDTESVFLNSGEEYEIEWELFAHSGIKDFMSQIKKYGRYIGIDANHYTVFENEDIEFTVASVSDEVPKISIGKQNVPVQRTDGGYSVKYSPLKTGEHTFKIKVGDTETSVKFMVKIEFEKLLENRAHFIVENQQCLDPKSPLYGAFLIYDNDYDAMYFDYLVPDHNACRERMNIGLFLMKYLQHKEDKAVRRAIDLYIDFVFREFYDEKTGEVFNNIGKHSEFIRLYNAPGVMLTLCEMYLVTGNERFLDNIVRLADTYYKIGGKKCYANGLAIKKVIRAFRKAGRREDEEHLMELFQTHVDNIISIGTSYPPHEVNYEQTIVTPAVQHISDMGTLRENKEHYIREAYKHMECLERFSGLQPDYRLYEIASRFWDDYFFGKNRMMGDTLPHHLSVLTGRAYLAYSVLSGDKLWQRKAEECIRNCMCLIDDDGHGHAAYVYPYRLNGKRGEFLDPWSNDQDLVLYDALYASEYIDSFQLPRYDGNDNTLQ